MMHDGIGGCPQFRLTQPLVEEIDGPLPGQGRCGLIITGRGIVVEAVIGTPIDMGRVGHAVCFKRCLIIRPSLVDSRIQPCIVQ